MDSPDLNTLKKNATRRWVKVSGSPSDPLGFCATYYWFEDKVWLHVNDPELANYFLNGKAIVPTAWGVQDMAYLVETGRIMELLPVDESVTEDGRHQTPADNPAVTDTWAEK